MKIQIDGDGINPDHCIFDNHHGIITVIPSGEIWLDGKLMTKPFTLRDRAMICFGRNSTFRFYPTLNINGSPVSQKRISIISSEYELDVLPGLVEVSQESK